MRPILILTVLGVLGLVLGAGVLAQPESNSDRALPDGPIVSTAIDAAPKDLPERVVIEGANPLTAVALLDDPLRDLDPADLDDEVIELATLPGRQSHTQNAYVAGSASSDLDLEEGVELYMFDDLLLPDYMPPAVLDEDEERGATDGFPEEVLALDGERIALEGYMQPLSFNGNKVASFVLSPYPPGCCFGGMPGLDEWVEVEVAGDGVDYFAYRVIRVTGELEVGEELDDWGYVASLYRMNSDKVEKLW